MIVSLEAIFLSTFVMISQNRADEKCEVIANQQWATVQVGTCRNRDAAASVLQASRFRRNVIVFRLNASAAGQFGLSVHFGGIRRNACTQSRRLITGGRRFKSCPRY
jgi:hypothetical protein